MERFASKLAARVTLPPGEDLIIAGRASQEGGVSTFAPIVWQASFTSLFLTFALFLPVGLAGIALFSGLGAVVGYFVGKMIASRREPPEPRPDLPVAKVLLIGLTSQHLILMDEARSSSGVNQVFEFARSAISVNVAERKILGMEGGYRLQIIFANGQPPVTFRLDATKHSKQLAEAFASAIPASAAG